MTIEPPEGSLGVQKGCEAFGICLEPLRHVGLGKGLLVVLPSGRPQEPSDIGRVVTPAIPALS